MNQFQGELGHVLLVLAVVGLLLLSAVAGYSNVLEAIEPPSADEIAKTKQALHKYLTTELKLQSVLVVIDTDVAGVAFAATTDDHDFLRGQVILAALTLATATPWVETIYVSPHFGGFPLSTVEVPMQSVRNLVNERITLEQFFHSWHTELMPTPLDLPGALLVPLSEAEEGWQAQDPEDTDGLQVLAQFELPELHDRFMENYPAAQSEVALPDGGTLKMAVIDCGDREGAEQLLKALEQELGGQAIAPNEGELLVAGDKPTSIRQRGGCLYLIQGPLQATQIAVKTLEEEPQVGPVQIASGAVAGQETPPAGGQTQQPGEAGTTQPPAGQTLPETPPQPQNPPLPLVADSVIKEAMLCEGVDERNKPVGVGDQFGPQAKKVGLFLAFEAAPANTEIALEWYRDGEFIFRKILLVAGDQRVVTSLYSKRSPYLQAGNYALEILENDRLVARLPFSIQ